MFAEYKQKNSKKYFNEINTSGILLKKEPINGFGETSNTEEVGNIRNTVQRVPLNLFTKVSYSPSESYVVQRSVPVPYGSQYEKDGRKTVLKSDVTYEDPNGYEYETDSEGRIISAIGILSLTKGTRNPYAQRTVGGSDRLKSDDGGHLIATQFGGSGDIDNLLPQARAINRSGGEWYKLEQTWKKALKEGKTVEVYITIGYVGSSERPDAYTVNYIIDTTLYSITMKNK